MLRGVYRLSLNASDLFVRALEAEGVEYVYGIPGEENLYLLEAIRKSGIKVILNRHEQAAGFMAATYGRLTGKPGVAISTLGPGATNFTTSAAYATLGGFPVLFITGQKPIKKSKQGRFQITDVVGMMKPITKYSQVICDANMVTSVVRQAFKSATEGKPGAVHIEFPEDVCDEDVTQDTKGVFQVSVSHSPHPCKNGLRELADDIKSATLPLVLVGSHCNTQETSKAMGAFIEATGLPFIATQMGKGVIAETHPSYIGTTSLSATDYVHDLTKRADLIINVGYDVVEKPPYFASQNTKVVHLSDVYAVADNIYAPDVEIVGDIAAAVRELAQLVGKCSQDFSYAARVKEALTANIARDARDASFPLKPQRIVSDVCEHMSGKGIVSLDNGMYKLWFARNYKAVAPNTLLLDNALATMGAGLPVAMECARLYPDKKVLAVCGDGGFMMNSQEMETAIRLGLNLVVLILNDNAYGMIRWKQDGMSLEDYAMTFNNPDFVKYAESYGARGHRVTKAEDLSELLEKCFDQKGVHLIDVPIDYSENAKVFSNELRSRAIVE